MATTPASVVQPVVQQQEQQPAQAVSLDALWKLGEVELAIQRLEKKERRAYQTALDVVPHIVQAETKIEDFLRTEDGNAERAARRLCSYWMYRKKFFGERWLLPMTQTGTGTLSMADVSLLRTGYQALFSRMDCTGDGLLIVVDFAKASKCQFDSASNVRIMMYLATVMTDQLTQTDGVTVVYVVRSAGMPPVDTNPEGYTIVHTALPLRMKQMIIARAFDQGKEGVLNYLAYQTARVNEFRSGMHPEQLISDSTKGTLALLEQKGVQRQFLPRCLGGDWTPDQFNDWVRMRLSLEDIMAPAPIKRNFLTPPSLQVLQIVTPVATNMAVGQAWTPPALTNTPAAVSTCAAAAVAATTEQERVHSPPRKRAKKKKPPKGGNEQRARQLNALYSRRSYHKQKLKVLGLEEQVQALQTHQGILQQEGRQLESALAMAQQILFSAGLQLPQPMPLPPGTATNHQYPMAGFPDNNFHA